MSNRNKLLEESRRIYNYFSKEEIDQFCDDCVLHNSSNGLLDSFNRYLELRIDEHLAGNLSESTIKADDRIMRALKNFVLEVYGKEEISLKFVDKEFLVRFNLWLTSAKKISKASMSVYMYGIRAFLRMLYDEGVIRTKPFNHLKIKRNHSTISYLTEPEIAAIRDFSSKEKVMNEARDIFLFMYNTGLAYIDYCEITEDNMFEQMDHLVLSGKRQKTGVEYLIPLTFEAQLILERYKNDPRIKNSKYLLPTMEHWLLNRKLKIIANEVGINKNVSAHIARHSFATNALMYGMDITSIQKVLGHRYLSSTLIYANVVDLKVCMEMDLFNTGVIRQMSTNYNAEDKFSKGMKVEMSLDDQSWLAKKIIDCEALISDLNNQKIELTTKLDSPIESISKFTELGLMHNLSRTEYKAYCFFRLCPNTKGSNVITSKKALQLSYSVTAKDIGIQDVVFRSIIHKFSEMGIISFYIKESEPRSYFISIEPINNWNKRSFAIPNVSLNKFELEWLKNTKIDFVSDQGELIMLQKCSSAIYFWLMAARIFEKEKKIIYSSTALSTLVKAIKGNYNMAMNKLIDKGFIQQVRSPGGKNRELFLTINGIEERNDLDKLRIKRTKKHYL